MNIATGIAVVAAGRNAALAQRPGIAQYVLV